MGTQTRKPPESCQLSSSMKVFFFSSVLLGLAIADSCSDCTSVVNVLRARLTSEESIVQQGDILVGGICPSIEDPTDCEANLPGFWAGIATLLWPEYWNPEADWMCAPTCAAPEQTNMTCDDCKTGIHAAIDQLLEEHTLDLIVDGLANGDFCANIGSLLMMRSPLLSSFSLQLHPDDEMCPTYVDDVIRQGLPLLTTMEGL